MSDQDFTAVELFLPSGLLFPIHNPHNRPIKVKALDPGNSPISLLIGGGKDTDGNQRLGGTFAHQMVLMRMIQCRDFDAQSSSITYSKLYTSRRSEHKALIRRLVRELSQMLCFRVGDEAKSTAEITPLLRLTLLEYYRDTVDASDPGKDIVESQVLFRKLTEVTFQEDFYRALMDHSAAHCVRFDAILACESQAAAALYLHLAPFAIGKKLKRDATNHGWDAFKVLQDVGAVTATIAAHPHRKTRHFFERSVNGKPSILERLDGMPIGHGQLRVEPQLRKMTGRKGWAIVFWFMPERESLDELKRLQAASRQVKTTEQQFLDAGLTRDDYFAAQQKHHRQLLGGEESYLKEMGYPVEEDKGYLPLMRSIFGPSAFNDTIGAAKQEVLEKGISGTNRIQICVNGFLKSKLIRDFLPDLAKALKASGSARVRRT